MARLSLPPLLLAVSGLLAAGHAHALQQSGNFDVVVRLEQKCVNSAWSESANASVEVTCSGGDFVQIEPIPGRPIVGTHGAAFRFHFAADALPSGVLFANADPYLGAGTITSLRIYNIAGEGSPLEMLVTF